MRLLGPALLSPAEPELSPPPGLRGSLPQDEALSWAPSLPFDSEEPDAHPSLKSDLYLLPDPDVLPGGPASGSFPWCVRTGQCVPSGRWLVTSPQTCSFF